MSDESPTNAVDPVIAELTGGGTEPPMMSVQRRPFGAGGARLNRGKPGQVGRNAAAVAARESHGTFGLPNENETRMRKRIDEARQILGRLFKEADKAQADVSARIAEIRGFEGGAAMAAGMNFELDAASDFLTKLDALLDEFLPKTNG